MGFSSFSSIYGKIALILTHALDPEKPLRLSRLILQNKENKPRYLPPL